MESCNLAQFADRVRRTSEGEPFILSADGKPLSLSFPDSTLPEYRDGGRNVFLNGADITEADA